MPQTALTNIGLNYNWDAGEDGWKAGMDNNLVLLDALAQAGLTVEFKTVSAEPASPANGAVYIIGPSPSGTDWGARAENDIAIFSTSTGWAFTSPRDGWKMHDRVTQRQYQFNNAVNDWLWTNKTGHVISSGSTYEPTREDANGLIESNVGGMSFNIPDDATVLFPVGTTLRFLNVNATAADLTADAAILWRGNDPTGTGVMTTDLLLEIVKTGAANTWGVVRNSALV